MRQSKIVVSTPATTNRQPISVVRVPMDLDNLAVAIAQGVATAQEEELFMQNMEKLSGRMFQKAHVFPTAKFTPEDMHAEALYVAARYINKYSKSIGHYSTYFGGICKKHVSQKSMWWFNKTHKEQFIIDSIGEDKRGEDNCVEPVDKLAKTSYAVRSNQGTDHDVNMLIRQTINDLIATLQENKKNIKSAARAKKWENMWPKYKELIRAVFGDTTSQDWICPSHFSITDAARAADIKHVAARRFFNVYVVPHLEKIFPEFAK